MNNRRDFLKFFGVGAVVVPLIEGMPSTENQAMIIYPPKIEISKPSDVILVDHIFKFGKVNVTVFVRDQKTRQVAVIDAEGFVMEYVRSNIDATHLGSVMEEFVPSLITTTLKISTTSPITLSYQAPELPFTRRERLLNLKTG